MKRITWAMIAALVVLQYQIWLHKGGLRSQYAQAQQQANTIRVQNDMLRRDNALLRAQVEDLQNGYEAVSEIARMELGYIQSGETLYRLPGR